VDEEGKWSVKLTNDLAKGEMTVDLTPRRCQQFKVKPGEALKWSTSAGQSGQLTAERPGLATVTGLRLQPGKEIEVTIRR
jgi:hypothetical protein